MLVKKTMYAMSKVYIFRLMEQRSLNQLKKLMKSSQRRILIFMKLRKKIKFILFKQVYSPIHWTRVRIIPTTNTLKMIMRFR